MESLWFHLIVVPGVFLLGRLSGSVKVTGFRARTVLAKGRVPLSDKRKKKEIK
ncbi:hypothetical protein [Laceyella putida]|uniref:Uncharacterized protein n=1 Tax=Laceyella putida TaxID=110101 RepID=A0ABW2RMF8_9BACL